MDKKWYVIGTYYTENSSQFKFILITADIIGSVAGNFFRPLSAYLESQHDLKVGFEPPTASCLVLSFERASRPILMRHDFLECRFYRLFGYRYAVVSS